MYLSGFHTTVLWTENPWGLQLYTCTQVPRAQVHMEIGFYHLKMLLLTSVLAAELVSAFKAHLKRWAVISRSTWEIKPSESNGRLIPVMLTTLELICTIFTILLPITKPHAGDAVPAGTGEVAFCTFLPVGDCGSQREYVFDYGECK